MNSIKVREAARSAFEKLSNLTDAEFERKLAMHADGDIAKALLDLHYFEVGEAESGAFQFSFEDIETVVDQSGVITFDYGISFLNRKWLQLGVAQTAFDYAMQYLVTTYLDASIDPASSPKYQAEPEECGPWRIAA